MTSMHTHEQIAEMDADALRVFAVRLIDENDGFRRDNALKQLKIDQLTHEMAILRRWRYGAKSERLKGVHRDLFEATLDADIEAIRLELEALAGAETRTVPKAQPRRMPLPAALPRTEIRHEPEQTVCACGCALRRIGEDVSEKLDYTPGVFTVERHIRGTWVCTQCETVQQAPVPPHVIDKGLPTTGLLAQVLVGKYLDHLPLNRQEHIFERAGLAIPRSTLAQGRTLRSRLAAPVVDALRTLMLERGVLHADETPVAMLSPGKGKTHTAYVWAYATTAYDPLQAVVYDFADSRAGKEAQRFLADWKGSLVCDDYPAYNVLFRNGVTEAGCLAHARRKFHELTGSGEHPVADEALRFFRLIYEIEKTVREHPPDERTRIRQRETQPVLETFHTWLILQRQRATDGTALASAIDYSLNRWVAHTRFASDGHLPVDNNHIENRIRPIALGRANWLFAGSLRGGQRAAAVMSLIQSAKLNGHDPYVYLKDVLTRLPTQRASAVEELLPHRWQPLVTKTS